MKNYSTILQRAAMLFSVNALCAAGTLSAQAPVQKDNPASPGEESTANAPDSCSKELLLSYFPEVFVTQTLIKFNVPQEKHAAIVKSLSNKDKDVVKQVEEKASAMNPNPLKDRDPSQRQVAIKIFRETLLQVFGDTMRDNGVSDTTKIQSMLDDIQQQKAKNFASCMEKQRTLMPEKNKQTSSRDSRSYSLADNTKEAKQMDDKTSKSKAGTDDDDDDDDDFDDEDTEEPGKTTKDTTKPESKPGTPVESPKPKPE